MRFHVNVVLFVMLLSSFVAGQKSKEMTAGKDERKKFFLNAPPKKKAPSKGYKLLLILPGGTGDAGFRPFCENIHRNAGFKDQVTVQLVAPIWSEEQAKNCVWVKESDQRRIKDCKFSTEEFIEAVVKEVKKKRKIDGRHVYTLGWSSGGPPCYAASLSKKSPVTGSFVAMSVFHPETLPSLKRAKGHAYYLLHSPEDWIKFSFAETARDRLAKAGAATKLATYKGGHGWHGDVFGNIKTGLEWLVKQNTRKKPKAK